ncbi:MAG: DUF402 domain-containing protein [Candidatus Methanofastidiosia archaeon]
MTVVRIRGIYTTALTKFFIENGYMINQMTELMRERFPEQQTYDITDVDIKHTKDLHGISIVGEKDVLEKIAKEIKEKFLDVFIVHSNTDLYGIYKGIVNRSGRVSLIDLGNDMGILHEPTEENEVLVQVLEMEERPLLTSRITFSGSYCVLIPEDDIKISRKINDEDERNRLLEIGKRIKPKNFGILWRTAAAYIEEKHLLAEAVKLSKNAEDVKEKFSKLEGPGLIQSGKKHMRIIFGKMTKTTLDKKRGEILPTITDHHILKSAGREISFAVDVTEKIINDKKVDGIDELFHKVLHQIKDPKIGDKILLEHVKPGTRTLYLEGAKIKKFSPPTITLKRYFSSRGYYDGLDIKKEKGDYAITKMEEEKWHFKHSYFDKNDALKGEYYNICTPIEIYPHKIRYIDLEIDVIKYPNGETHIIDEDLLENKVSKRIFPERIADIAKNEAKSIIKNIKVSLDDQ